MDRALIVTPFAVMFLSVSAVAQSPAVPVAKPVAALQQCRALTDAAARLACYDWAVDGLNAATASGDVVVVERTEMRKARKGLFGFTLPRIGFLTGKPDNAEDRADEAQLETTVTAARSIGNGKWRFTVEGGALWETVEATMGFRDPAPGKKVLIEKGIMGAYFVAIAGGRRVQAKRIG